jgi:hypothetical protein
LRRLRDIAAFLILSACTPAPEREHRRDVLRISIFSAVSPIVPITWSGAIAYLGELVFRPAREYFTDAARSDGKLSLTPRPEAPPAAVLAPAVRSPGIKSAVARGSTVEAELAADAPAPGLDEIFLDLGPFEQASLAKEKLTLRRRSGAGIGTIEVIGTSGEEEEWRRLLARDVDLVPTATPSHLRYLSEVPSVHIVPITQTATTGLIFNVSGPVMRDVRLRRAASLALRRAAIAEVVASDRSAAVYVSEDGAQASKLVREAGGPTLRVAVIGSLSDDVRAAMVVEQQLEEVGFRVECRVLSFEEMNEIYGRSRDFDVGFLVAGYEPIYFRRALSGHRGNITGYANPEFDAAVAAGDSARAIQILEHDVPFTPLYRVKEGVALNAGFCGVHPRVSYDWSWLADIHACAPGETE